MKIKKVVVLLAMAVMMVFSATACGTNKGNESALENNKQDVVTLQPENQQPESRQPENQQPEKQNTNENKAQGAGEFDVQADLEGSVYEFTKEGFSLSPADSFEDGEGLVMKEAAPGAEDTSKLVSITYADNCIFQIVVIDAAALKQVSREDTTSESIKKQTDVRVYGNCQDATHWTAERVVIIRIQRQ